MYVYKVLLHLICDFSFLDADLSNTRFMECEFYDCNLSSANVFQTGFQDVIFKDCKMLGIDFEKCSDFAFNIKVDNCQLSHASFYKMNLSKMIFKVCKLEGVDFTECNLSTSVFDNCDLLNATFLKTNLEKADFRTSKNFIIDPENNHIKGAKFSRKSVDGLLSKYLIKIE